jgi:hypothetical protein
VSSNEYHLPLAICPACGHSLNAADSVAPPHRKPEPGDWTVCIGCAGVLEFDGNLRFTAIPEPALELELKRNPILAKTVLAIRKMHAALGRPRETGRPH